MINFINTKEKSRLLNWNEEYYSRSVFKVSIIQCYAPTNDAEETKKEEFYSVLQDLIDKEREKDITIVMGDFNAQIGSDNTSYEEVMAKHGLGEMNENGELFADLCALNQLVIGGSVFPHKTAHKATWVSPDHTTENQIDHVCISKKIRRSLYKTSESKGEQTWHLTITL